MKTKYTFHASYFIFLVLGLISLSLVSCGSSQYAAEDGIYSNSAADERVAATENENSNYYKQYFKTKNAEYGSLPEENLIFTDIDSYVSEDYIDEEGYIVTRESDYDEGYGAWGTNADNVTINIYETGFNNFGWGGYYGGFYGNGWGWGWNNPWAWNGFGWGGYWGWNNPWAWNGWGWGGYYGGWGGYYGGWHGYHGGYYGGHHGFGNNIAYNRGRRNTGDFGGRSNDGGRNSYARSENTRRGYSRDVRNSVRRYNSRNTNSTRASRGNYSRNNGINRSNIYRNSSNSRSRAYRRSAAPNRSRSNTRSTNSSSRGSGSFRSSGGSRSSGSVRSSGGGSRSSGSRGGGSRRGGGDR